MKSKVVLVAFLLMLYIGPMIFISSAILAEPNTNKDFSLSTEYETSDESITSFSETLPDDVLFYPDSDNFLVQNAWNDWDSDSDPLTIKYNDYNATKTNTTTEYDPSVSGGIQPSDSFVMAWGYRFTSNTVEVQFNFTLPSLVTYTSLTLNTIMSGSADTNTLSTTNNGTLDGGWYIRVWNWDTSSYVQLDYKNSGLTWGYSTALDIDNADYFNSTTRTIMIKYSVTVSEQYVGIWIYSSSITLGLGITGFTESFADVSDWSAYGTEDANDNHTTDGDVARFSGWWKGSGTDSDFYFTNSPAITDTWVYIEIRAKLTRNGANGPYLYYYELDDHNVAGEYSYFTLTGVTTVWTTQRYTLSWAYGIESLMMRMYTDQAGEYWNLEIDYLRIGPADEMGWQHDGSVTRGTTSDGVYLSSDTDLLTVTNLNSGDERVIFNIDSTTTRTKIDPTLYPFLGISISSVTDGGSDNEVYRVQAYSDGWHEILAIGDATGILHACLRGVTSADIEFIAVQMEDVGDVIVIDWIKAYSIANFTVAVDASCTVTDYLYVDSGVLCSNIDSGYIQTNYDPALSIVTGVNSLWTLTTSLGTPESDYYVSAWAGYSSETEGALAKGTLTDLKLKFTDDANVAAITFFIAPPQWYESGEVELLFSVPLDETGLDMLLIFLGLIMIPLSTIYLVKGGRSKMSSNKLFYGLIAFTIGWALFLGGIYG